MLSKALTQLYERARIRFAVEIEIFDAFMNPVYPRAETELDRGVRDSPGVQAALLECVSTARAGQVMVNEQRYDLVPLRRPASTQTELALAAVRHSAVTTELFPEFWVEFVRSTVDADAANLTALAEERRRSRLLLGTLRFLGQLAQTECEGDLKQAVIQAAAVWFDADARVYQQNLKGEFMLDAALPGALVPDEARRLTVPADAAGVQHTSTSALWADGNDAEAILVPLSTSESASAILLLVGAKVNDPACLPILGQVAAAQIELSRAARRGRVRAHFLDLIQSADMEAEALALELVRELVAATGAESAALTLESQGRSRRLVSLGDPPANPRPAGGKRPWAFDPEQFLCDVSLPDGVTATLDMRPAEGATFSSNAAMVAQAAMEILSPWLRALGPALVEASMTVGKAEATATFLRRIDEELERAKRFDLRLGLVVVDLPPQLVLDHRTQLEETLRTALRGSDLLGPVGANRLAALLTHTDRSGSGRVVERLRRGLARSATRLRVDGVVVGHADFSPTCRTADAMVLAAARDALPLAAV